MLCPRPRRSSGFPNFLAMVVSVASLCVILGNFDPVPAGEDPGSTAIVSSSSLPDPASSERVPLPPEVASISAESAVLSLDATSANSLAGASGGSSLSSGMRLNNDEAIKFSLLLMQDGCRFVENIRTYSVVFNKQERIQGDLGDVQTIEMKVRHEPCFSVYMKWKNGDTGRQLLYNEEYEDRKMVVKLGGLKGRILPALKLEPTGPEAMAQARYPVTEAGMLGMLKLLVFHRQNDLKSGEGVRCIRLENCVVDERECYCFLYEYESQKFNPTYRKSMLMLDTRYHVPLRVVNHTWSNSSEGLTAAELDEQTLIEDYSFLRMDFGRELVVEDFSRENPAYRM